MSTGLTADLQELVKHWIQRASDRAAVSGRLGPIAGQAALAESDAVRQCIHELLVTVVPPMGECPGKPEHRVPREPETGG